MVRLRLVLQFLLLRELELAKVHDLADRLSFLERHFDEVELDLAGHFHGLRGRHHAQHLSVGPDEPNRSDANLIVDSLASIFAAITVAVAVENSRRQGNSSPVQAELHASPGR